MWYFHVLVVNEKSFYLQKYQQQQQKFGLTLFYRHSSLSKFPFFSILTSNLDRRRV